MGLEKHLQRVVRVGWVPLGALLFSAVVVALTSISVPPSVAGPTSDPTPEAVTAAFVAGDCARCHDVPGIEKAGRLDHCRDCHLWVKAVSADPAKRGKAMEIFPKWERYEKNVATYLTVPSLDAAMARLDPEWVRAYLHDPRDIRPHMPETMPRFALTDAQVDAIVFSFRAHQVAVPPTPKPDPAKVAEGRALFVSMACTTCHTFGGQFTDGKLPLAPDLQHTRARMSPDAVAAWIRDPAKVSPAATMPSFGLTEPEVIAVRDFLLLADPQAVPAKPLLGDIAPATRPVTYDEVEAKVFGKICIHCHMDPEKNQGRAGPGNAGGFGFPATGIELEDRDGIAAVKDRIREALLRRRLEAHRDYVKAGESPAELTRPEKPGMPLGLPPIPDEDIALVLAWFDQGMPE